MTNTAGSNDQSGLSWIPLTDFSPGIYDGSAITAGIPPNVAPGVFPAPPGAADVNGTYGCIALPNGGLGPLPGLSGIPGTTGLSLSDMGISVSGAADITAVTNSLQTINDEIVIGVTTTSGGSQVTHFYSYQLNGGTLHTIYSQSYSFTNNKNFCTYPFFSIIAAELQPVLCLPLAAPDGPNSNLMLYPNPTTPASFTPVTITTNATGDGTAFGHQGRVVVNTLLAGAGWPTGVSYSPNEAFNYTDPAQSLSWPQQYELFGPESPFGYGAVNSVSAGELFLVKCHGGAIIIQGDLNNPTVTQLPAVKSTGLIYGRSDSDENGMYYGVEEAGMWVWNGGNTSTKISRQLDDAFFQAANAITGPFGVYNVQRYYYYCQRWSDWMLVSNNWLFDSAKGSWWRLENPALRSYFYYFPGFVGQWMFAAPMTVTSGSQKFLFEYNLTVPRSSWNWQSLPLQLSPQGRTGTVREIVVRASNPYGDADPEMQVNLIDDKGNNVPLDMIEMATGTEIVQAFRLTARLSQTATVAVQVVASGTTSAPVLHGLEIGFRTREHLGVT